MRAILIDTPNKQIIEVEHNGDFKQIHTLLHCDCFTCVVFPDGYDAVYVDDEGLINGNPHGWFVHADYPSPLRGYGLVLGTDENGASVEPLIDINALRAKITFPSEESMGDPESYAHMEVRGFDNSDDFLKALGLKP